MTNSYNRNEGSTKQSSPGDNNSSSNSSPEKMVKALDRHQGGRLDFDGSYDGDADDATYRNGKSRLKNRRNSKKTRKDTQIIPDTPSASEGDELLLND